jgi:YHS domain-containing protein
MTRHLLPICVLSIALAAWAFAGPATQPAAPPTTQPKAVNDFCIVETDHPVDDRETVVYKGQVIGFCCPDCKAQFLKDPDKYIGNLDQK